MLDPLRLSLPWPSCRRFLRDGPTIARALGGRRTAGGLPRGLSTRLPSTVRAQPVPPSGLARKPGRR
jgi:hypothetical protein